MIEYHYNFFYLKYETLTVSFPGSWKPELGFPNHKFIQLWTGGVSVGDKPFQ